MGPMEVADNATNVQWGSWMLEVGSTDKEDGDVLGRETVDRLNLPSRRGLLGSPNAVNRR